MAEHHTHYTDRHPSSPDDPGFVRVQDAGPIKITKMVTGRVAEKAWDHSIFSKAATAAFWQTLSLPPLLLGLLGSLGYIGGWFGPDTMQIIQSKIIAFSRDVFSGDVVDQLIGPTVADVLQRGRPGIISVGFLISLWAGSSAMSTFVDSIVEAHDQHEARHPVWQRIFALILYVAFLITAVFVLPIVALGPTMIAHTLPEPWYDIGSQLLDFFYYPGVALILIVGLTTLYKLALHRSLPWHRLLGGALLAGVFFIAASAVLRLYLRWVTQTGVSYGALASTIAFLLFTFFLGFAVVLGAEFNATIQEFWPARATRIEQMREWLSAQATERPTIRVATGPIRVATDKMRDLVRGDSREDAEALEDAASLEDTGGHCFSRGHCVTPGQYGDDRATTPGSGTSTRSQPSARRLTGPRASCGHHRPRLPTIAPCASGGGRGGCVDCATC